MLTDKGGIKMELGATLPEVPRALYLHSHFWFLPAHVTMSSAAAGSHFHSTTHDLLRLQSCHEIFCNRKGVIPKTKQQPLANLNIEGLCGFERGI